MSDKHILNVTQCMYCQCANFNACMRCKDRCSNGYLPYKLRPHSIGEYRMDIKYGNIRTKKAWEMLPMGYKLLFLAIVAD